MNADKYEVDLAYGISVMRHEQCARLVDPGPERYREAREAWEFFKEVFWPCLLFSLAVTVLRATL